MSKFAGNTGTLVADVDCTGAGKDLCSTVGVQGYPTLKHGDPSNLDDYKGGRTYSDLLKFAKGLKPVCNPSRLELCDAESQARIGKILDLEESEIQFFIADAEKKLKANKQKFDDGVKELQARHTKMTKEKDAAEAEIRNGGLGLYRSVLAQRKAQQEITAGSPDARRKREL